MSRFCSKSAIPGVNSTPISDPHHEYRRLGKADLKVIHISLAETLTKSNYQDMQRFMPVDLAIFGDGESSLPALTEAVKSATNGARRSVFANRADKLREEHERIRERVAQLGEPGLDHDTSNDGAPRR
jgi:thiamine pyrophosphate-dependent acetolactate synthase large subunit-like protein